MILRRMMKKKKTFKGIKKKIVIATKNPGKVREMQDAFANVYSVELVSLADVDSTIEEPVEDGASFRDNSRIKAEYYAKATGMPCLADDSGLEVELLNGAPGIFSARYAGENATDEENNSKLVAELREKGIEKSDAAYRCVLTFVDTDGTRLEAEGLCSGEIRLEARGENGFGYDPYFYIGRKSMAELSLEAKQGISHRGRAMEKMAVLLKEYMKEHLQ